MIVALIFLAAVSLYLAAAVVHYERTSRIDWLALGAAMFTIAVGLALGVL